jgi:hypothetical protein
VAELGRDADPIMLHLNAALAEKERRLISERTKPALAAKRRKVLDSAICLIWQLLVPWVGKCSHAARPRIGSGPVWLPGPLIRTILAAGPVHNVRGPNAHPCGVTLSRSIASASPLVMGYLLVTARRCAPP